MYDGSGTVDRIIASEPPAEMSASFQCWFNPFDEAYQKWSLGPDSQMIIR